VPKLFDSEFSSRPDVVYGGRNGTGRGYLAPPPFTFSSDILCLDYALRHLGNRDFGPRLIFILEQMQIKNFSCLELINVLGQ
jgi:hypothetical protein